MNSVHKMIHKLHNPDAGILFLRIALGSVFLHAGYLKYTNMAMVIAGFSSMGFPVWLAYAVTGIELLGGALLLIGLFSRYAGIALAIIMLSATYIMRGNGFGLQNQGFEYTFVLMLCSMAIVTMGSGSYSVARLLRKRK